MNKESVLVLSLSSIGWFVIWILAAIALVFLILNLRKLYLIVKDIKSILNENSTNINKILDEAPDLVKNIEEITAEVSHGAQAFRGTVDNVAGTSETITESIGANDEAISSLASVAEILGVIKALYDKYLSKK